MFFCESMISPSIILSIHRMVYRITDWGYIISPNTFFKRIFFLLFLKQFFLTNTLILVVIFKYVEATLTVTLIGTNRIITNSVWKFITDGCIDCTLVHIYNTKHTVPYNASKLIYPFSQTKIVTKRLYNMPMWELVIYCPCLTVAL